MFKNLAEIIWNSYKSSVKKKRKLLVSKKRIEMISSLNPGRDSVLLTDKFYISKIEKMIIFSLIGIIFIILAIINRHANRLLDDNNQIRRNDYGKDSYEASLIAKYEDNEYELDITIEEREYKSDEIERLYKECETIVSNKLLNENKSFDHVETNLKTVDKVNGYPFYIQWETSDYDLISPDGTVLKPDSEYGKCILTAFFTYKNYKFEQIYNITVYSPVLDEKEKKINEIIASIQHMQEKTQYDSYLLLPSSIGKKTISWKESKDYTPVMVATLLFLALLGMWIGIDNDLAKKYRERNQILNLEYAEFVSKLQLLIGSGMTVRNAFERMEADYIDSRNEGGKMKYVYEELRICLKRMHEGFGEEESLNNFGNRCNHISYKKLVTLLIQNSKKGTTGLIQALGNETKNAFEERKQIARRLGEEAQTKLLFPMIIMLVVVMIIIIIPAYVSFGM